MQARDNITEEIKEAARRSEAKPFAAMDSVWDRIEERLDEDERKKGKAVPFRTISIAATILLLLSLGGVYLSQTGAIKKDDDKAYVQQEKSNRTSPVNDPVIDPVNKQNTTVPEIQQSQPEWVTNGVQRQVKKHKAPAVSPVIPKAILLPDQPFENHDVFVAQKVVKGNVKDESGAPVPGAMVIVKGMREGTLTDFDGNYEIKVPGDRDELEIIGLGMVSATVAIGTDQMLSTTLKPDGQVALNEISYHNRKDGYKNAQNRNIAHQPVTDIARALEGDLPGVKITQMRGQAGSPADLLIGGLNNQNTSGPLVVIDGMFYSGSSVSLKPTELESLTVLKDETATATYGSKGSNGVIVIKTKTGKGYSAPKGGFFKKVKGIFNRK